MDKVFNTNDPQLTNLLAEADLTAFNSIYHSYYQQLVYFGYTLTANRLQAEDAATEAFVHLWNARTTFKNNAHIKSYLFQAVKHTCLDFIRSSRTHSNVHQQLRYISENAENSIEQAIAESEIIKEIAGQISQLPPKCGQVFSLIFFDGMTTEQVAAEMNISTKNVLNQKGIAVKQIRMELLKKGLFALALTICKFFS